MTQTILLVEDNPKDLEFTLVAIEKCDLPHTVVIARDGEEALDYLLSNSGTDSYAYQPPALILLDIKLPKIDGIEVLKEIRFTPSLASIPVVILSSSALHTDLDRAWRFGISEYIVKPIDWTVFQTTMCKVLNKYIDA